MGLGIQPATRVPSLTADAAIRRVGNRLEEAAEQRTDQTSETSAPQRGFSIWRALGNFVSGLASPITCMFSSWQNFAIGAGMLVGGIALMIATGGAAAPLLLTLGLGMGGYQAVNGVVKLATARNAQEAEAAFHDFGAATSVIGLSVLGARASLKPVGVNTTGMSRLGATVQNIKSIPTSLRTSWTAFRSGQWRSNFTQFGNQVSTTVQAVKASFKDGTWKSNIWNFITNLFRRNKSKPKVENEIVSVAEENNGLRVIADERLPNNGRTTATQNTKGNKPTEAPLNRETPSVSKTATQVDTNKLIAGLNEVESEVFLNNMESLLKRMSVEDLLHNERILDILHQRYTKLGNNIINWAGYEARGGFFDQNPLAYFRVLETWRKSPTGCTWQNPLVHGPTTRYHVANEIGANTVLEATFGGGWRFIIDFLLGKNKGYQIDPAGVGIMVGPLDGLGASPHFYANRIIGQMFDSPAILRFRVPAQSLTAHGPYEAGLLHTDLNMISDIELTNLYTGQTFIAKTIGEFLALFGK